MGELVRRRSLMDTIFGSIVDPEPSPLWTWSEKYYEQLGNKHFTSKETQDSYVAEFTIPEGSDTAAITAEVTGNTLRVTIPRTPAEPQETQKIEVKQESSEGQSA